MRPHEWGCQWVASVLASSLREPLAMVRSRLRGALGALTFAVGVTAIAAWAFAGDRASHPRDEQAFAAYVSNAGNDMATAGGSDAALHNADYDWAARHPARMLSEGDRACDWLAKLPDAPDLAADGSFEAHTLVLRYVDTARIGRRLDQTHLGQTYLVAGAWAFLCRDTRSAKTAPTGAEQD